MKSKVLILLIAATLGACGGKSAPIGHEQRGTARGIHETATPAAGGTASGSPSATKTPEVRGSGQTSSGKTKSKVRLSDNIPTYAKGTQHAPLKVEMSACVARPGVQRLTITSAPGLQVSWGTMWADGEPHRDWAAFGVGVIAPNGEYTSTFPVRVDAPLGETRTDVAVAGQINGKDMTAFDQVYWTVAKSC